MNISDSTHIIQRFLGKIRLDWQIIFLVSIVAYGISFLHHLNHRIPPPNLSYFKALDMCSFVLAIGLAMVILFKKRNQKYPDLNEKQLTQKLTRSLRKPLFIIWIMGGAIVLIGVIFYCWTFEARNMHIYFIVGVYSLIMNYPRKELFLDIPYLIKEIILEREKYLNKLDGRNC
jgi:sterol desaturase/sphingolipid hydroxylase (fatty acid hydroxylase superfamily)